LRIRVSISVAIQKCLEQWSDPLQAYLCYNKHSAVRNIPHVTNPRVSIRMFNNVPEMPQRTANRRGFIKDSSLLLAGSTLGKRAPVHPGGSEMLRVGLVGCGGQGTALIAQTLANEKPAAKLTAIADVFEDRMQQCIRTLRGGPCRERVDIQARRFVGLEGYKALLESDVQVVVLATPPGFRPLHFSAAIAAGKHVYAESPVAVDAPGAQQFFVAGQSAEDRHLAVCVGLESRQHPIYRESVDRIRAGAVGDITYCRAYWNQGPMWIRQRAQRQTELEYQLRNWYYFTWLSGDHIVEQHTSNLDVINWLMDAPPVLAQGVGGRQLRTGLDCGQIYDHHVVEFTYANGTKLFSMCRQMPHCWNHVGEYVHGTLGVSEIASGQIQQNGHPIGPVINPRRIRSGGLSRLLVALSERRVPNESLVAYQATMTAIMGRMSTYSGKETSWSSCANGPLRLANVDSLRSLTDSPPVLPKPDGGYPIFQPGCDAAKI
jgi:myo-inositol 2-dehydrogenase / D-chiro-inositol 1-dehydrogenase